MYFLKEGLISGCFSVPTLWYNLLFSHSNNFWIDFLVCLGENKKHEQIKEQNSAITQTHTYLTI